MGVDQGVDRETDVSPIFVGEGDTISNVPLTNWSKFIFYLVENCHSHVLLTMFKHLKHDQNDNFSLYTIFDCFIVFGAFSAKFVISILHTRITSLQSLQAMHIGF